VRATGGRRTLDLTRRFAPRPCGAHFVRLSRNFRCARMTRSYRSSPLRGALRASKSAAPICRVKPIRPLWHLSVSAHFHWPWPSPVGVRDIG